MAGDLDAVLDWLVADRPTATPQVEEKARLLLLDTLGCAIAGFAKPELKALVGNLSSVEAGDIALPGCPKSLSPLSAAYVMGIAACWDEACEGLARAHGRPGLHSIPPALALGLARDGTLGETLGAIVAGYEVAGRLGEALRIRPGMHVDGTWGTFGAATAAAFLTAPDPGSVRATAAAAIEAAACQLPYSLYLPITQGATVRNAYVGHAATQGVLLAQTALAGVTSPAGALEAYDRLALGHERDAVPVAPAGEWLILQGYLKPFAAVRHVHYGAAAAIAWRRRHQRRETRHIERLRLSIYEEARTYCGNRHPATAIQAQFSLSYGLAWSLLHGDLGPEAYLAESLSDPEVARLERLVEIETDEALTEAGGRGARLAVGIGDEDTTVSVDRVPGDPDLPLSRGETLAKFLRYASPHIGAEPAERLAASLLEGDLHRPVRATLA